MFFHDLRDALGSHVSDYTICNLLSPLCERAMSDKREGKLWDHKQFQDELLPRFQAFYECNWHEAPKLFEIFMVAIASKLPVYLQ